ncbi:MAG TPA: efflux RND transporter periplasmic adaptor subunit [Bryobacteraceae bacterium]|jgi:RND family efflux transporter MFP subunit
MSPTAVVAPAIRESLSSTLTVAGQFEPYQDVDLHAKVSGYIRRINVDIGDRVRIGQVIATLEVPELEAQVSAAQAEVRHSQSEIIRAQSEVVRAQSNHTALHAAYTRLAQAAEQRPGLVAEQELDDARAKDQDSEAQINVAKSALEATREQLGISQADNQRVQVLSDYSVVTAPFTGVITKRYADTGSLIQAGTASNTQAMPVVRVAQSDLLRLRMPVPEADVPFIQEGGDVQIRVQATGKTFTGKIIRFTRSLDPSTRTMLAEVDVPNPGLVLSPGMFAETVLGLQHRSNALTIPSQAVVQGDGRSYVLVVNAAGKVEKCNVTLGIQGADRTEILHGLSAGQSVIVSGQVNYQAGETVRPKQEPKQEKGKQ